MLAAVKQDGNALKHASLALQADKQVVLAAVAQDCDALQHASEALKADREVVLAAVAQNGDLLQHASTVQEPERHPDWPDPDETCFYHCTDGGNELYEFGWLHPPSPGDHHKLMRVSRYNQDGSTERHLMPQSPHQTAQTNVAVWFTCESEQFAIAHYANAHLRGSLNAGRDWCKCKDPLTEENIVHIRMR